MVEVNHLLERRHLCIDQIIRQYYREGLSAQNGFSAKHGMPQSERFGLTHVRATHMLGYDVSHLLKELLTALALQLSLKLIRLVEVILYGSLITARDKDHMSDARVDSLFQRVLDEWLSTTGSISFGLALVTGKKRVPNPATGKTALVTLVKLPPIRSMTAAILATLPRPAQEYQASQLCHACFPDRLPQPRRRSSWIRCSETFPPAA